VAGLINISIIYNTKKEIPFIDISPEERLVASSEYTFWG
jgi:hypothetical protein